MSDLGAPTVRIEVLGALRAWRGDIALDLGPVQQQVVLAVLLLQQGRAISRQQLFSAVWGDAEPSSATTLVQRHVSEARQALELSKYVLAEPGYLAWTNAGYVLAVPAGGLDLDAFDRNVDTARKARAAGDMAGAAENLRSALGLWRGPLCDGLTSPFLDAQRDRLEERRVGILEECIELDLAVGDRDDLVSELRQLVTEHPFRERMHGLLMLALYRSGRRADALAAFHEARRLLREELGVEPAAALQQLHQQILSADPELGSRAYRGMPSASSALNGNRLPVPAQLPHSVAGFSGRQAEIEWLNALLPGESDDTAATVVITALAGTAGVGKTALAVHWAQQIRDRFPDGQLYVNLRGFDPAGSAMEATDAIRAFLDAFAVPPDRIPVDLDAQAALYRTMLVGRRILIVLDNARDAAHVRPLLPGSPTCLVLVTSRNQMLSLVAADGARLLEIDLLPPDQARDLLASRLGEFRVAAEPAAVDEIVDACAGLPLALSIVSAHAAVNPRLPLAGLAGELRETRGLEGLNAGDKHTDVRDVFSWSYRALSASAARLFRMLGLHEGPDIGLAAAASLAGLPLAQARALLTELTTAHLLAERTRGRFAFHDLLRAYARELAEADDPAEDRRAAIHRVLDHYLWTAYRANELLAPSRDDAITIASAMPLVEPEDLVDHRRALAWLTTEYPVLLAALRQAASQGFDAHAWQLAWAMASFLERGGHWHDAATSQRRALAAANRLGDLSAQATSHVCLATYAYVPLGRYAEAEDHLIQALALYETLGDRTGQARAHRSLALLFDRQDRYAEALDHAQQALELFQTSGHRFGQAREMNAVGWYHIQLGQHEQGLSYCQQALDLQREINDQERQADTLDSMATAYAALGNHEEAIVHYQQAVGLYREFGHRHPEGDILSCLGDLHLAYGRPDEAREAWLEALAIFDELGHAKSSLLRVKLGGLAPMPGIVSPA